MTVGPLYGVFGRKMVASDVDTALGYVPARDDWADVTDFGAGVGGDDAAAIRAAIASGKRLIFVPPGDYTMKSTVTTYGSAVDPSCFRLGGLNGVWILAYGARFLIDNSISSQVVCTLSIDNNSKHCGVLGGEFVGNQTGTALGAENVAINLGSCSNTTIRDIKISGETVAGFSGVYHFETVIENVLMTKVMIGFDFAHCENLRISHCHVIADPRLPVAGINYHYDLATLHDNNVTNEDGSTRLLNWGQANHMTVVGCEFEGFQNSISMDGMRFATIRDCTLRGTVQSSGLFGTAGVVMFVGPDSAAASIVTSDILITNCDISSHGITGTTLGAGVLFNPNVTNVHITENRIFDNVGYGINAANLPGLSGLHETFNDYTSRAGLSIQVGALHPNLVTLVTTQIGTWTFRTVDTLTSGPITSTASSAAIYLENLANISFKDGAGTYCPVVGNNAANTAFLRSTADTASVMLQNKSGTVIAEFNTAGGIALNTPVTVSGGITALQSSGAAIQLKNNTNISFGDAAAVERPTIGVSPAEVTFLRMVSDTGEIALQNRSGVDQVVITSNGTQLNKGLGVFGVTPPGARPTVSGSRGGNAALASLLTAIAATGLITDGTTA